MLGVCKAICQWTCIIDYWYDGCLPSIIHQCSMFGNEMRNSWDLSEVWLKTVVEQALKPHGKNFRNMFFDVFWQAESKSEVGLLPKIHDHKISRLSCHLWQGGICKPKILTTYLNEIVSFMSPFWLWGYLLSYLDYSHAFACGANLFVKF